jgi:hypothetical protein
MPSIRPDRSSAPGAQGRHQQNDPFRIRTTGAVQRGATIADKCCNSNKTSLTVCLVAERAGRDRQVSRRTHLAHGGEQPGSRTPNRVVLRSKLLPLLRFAGPLLRAVYLHFQPPNQRACIERKT